MKKILAWVLALSLLLCGAAFAEEAEEVHVKVGVVGENNEQWEQVIIPTLAEEGIIIELVKFSDYIIPNQALAQGEIDMNAFQHYDFMNSWNEENSAAYGVTLVGLCDTLIAPLCIYSDKITSLDELKEGDQIAIMIEDGFTIHNGHPTFNKRYTDPINAQQFAAEMIRHNYREGWELPAMPK